MQITYTLKDLDQVAKQIISKASSKVLLFNAEMGMGKTTLIKAIVKALGSNDNVSSPTFSLVNEYKTKNETIYHFDLYRIENEEELYGFGIEDYFNSNGWLLIEWPELVKPLINDKYTVVSIIQEENKARILNIC